MSGPAYRRLTRVRFVNPHAYIYFDVMDEQGNAVPWRCELQAGSLLRRAGWTTDLFPIGGEVEVTGSAGTRERTACALQTVTLPDGSTLDRYGQRREKIDAPVGSAERVVDGKLALCPAPICRDADVFVAGADYRILMRTGLLFVVVIALFYDASQAHHFNTASFTKEPAAFEGCVDACLFRNPHVVVQIVPFWGNISR